MINGRRQPSCGGTSRMTRACQIRFCERLGVQFPRPTRQNENPCRLGLCQDFDRQRTLAAFPKLAAMYRIKALWRLRCYALAVLETSLNERVRTRRKFIRHGLPNLF